MIIPIEKIKQAQELIRPVLHRTPMFSSKYLSSQTGARVHLKAELFQKTGSFKPRGVLNKLKHLTSEEKNRGIVTVSAGNHAQAVAYATALEGIPCTVVMPAHASPSKLEATRGYGARVVLHEDMRTIFERTEEVRKERDSTLLHPFDDPDVIAGQGTVGLEILEDVPDVELIVVGIGGGGLVSGITSCVKQVNPRVKVFGVEPVGACGMHRAVQEGKPVRLEKLESIADGLSAPYAGTLPLAIVQRYLEPIVLVEDSEILAAIKILLERAKLLVEPAGAAGTAAVLSGKISCAGKNTVLVLSGGNLSLNLLKEWL